MMAKNVSIYKSQASALAKSAAKDVKVVVVANPGAAVRYNRARTHYNPGQTQHPAAAAVSTLQQRLGAQASWQLARAGQRSGGSNPSIPGAG